MLHQAFVMINHDKEWAFPDMFEQDSAVHIGFILQQHTQFCFLSPIVSAPPKRSGEYQSWLLSITNLFLLSHFGNRPVVKHGNM